MRIFHLRTALSRRAHRRAAFAVACILSAAACGGATGPERPRTGALNVDLAGLPNGATASVTLSGPGGYSRLVAASAVVSALAPGQYTVAAAEVTAGDDRFGATPAAQVAIVTPGDTATARVGYLVLTGSIVTSASGLPAGTSPSVLVTGPNGFARTITAGFTLGALVPGAYRLAPAPVVIDGDTYTPVAATLDVTVAPSRTPVSASLRYTVTSGRLTITITGLPTGVSGGVTITGPFSFTRTVSANTTLSALVPGTYTVTASTIANGTTIYTPAPPSQPASVTPGATASVTVGYTEGAAPPPGALNLVIDGMHVQQVVQDYAGAVPMVAGRDGLLRVFVRANAANNAAPSVRVRFYNGATLTSTATLNAPSSSVPQVVAEGAIASSWNYAIPGALMQPGLRILADVDPGNIIAESSDSDNAYPATGTPAAIDVRAVAALNLRFIPVVQSVNGLQGGVTAANAASYRATAVARYPLQSVDADVRAPFTTSAPVLQSDDANGAWGQILSEINALRVADGSARYYYGIVKTSYSSGIAGLGYVPGRAAIGWDFLPSASGVMAHEIGHNFGRFHAPGCGSAGADPTYPKADGKIGVYGYDAATNALKSPSTNYDLMGYCSPAWISDYTYVAVMNHRAANPFTAAASVGGNVARPGLLVWGRIANAEVILEPAFQVDAPASLPTRSGRNRLQGYGPLGEPLFDLTFDGERPADHPDPTARHFAFVIPIDAMRGNLPTRIRATAPGRQVEFTAAAASTASADAPVAERLDARTVRIRWRGGAARGALVRDARTSEILAFGRGGEAIVRTAEGSVDVTTSDGVQGTRRRIGIASSTPPPRR